MSDDSGKVHPYFLDDDWPIGSLMVGEASGWEDVSRFEAATSSRVLVVEYPPAMDITWTRYWLRGVGWPNQGGVRKVGPPTLPEQAVVPSQSAVPIPGLVMATKILPLAAHPEQFHWQFVDLKNYLGPNRFLELGHQVGPIFCIGWMLFGAVLVVWGAWLVSNEHSSRLLPTLYTLLLLSPAAIAVTGQLERQLGMPAWSVWLFVSAFGLLSLSAILNGQLKRRLPKCHALFAVYLVSAVVLTFVDPIWSFESPVLGGRVWPVSPIAMASWIGSLGGVSAFLPATSPKWIWGTRAVLVTLSLYLWLGHPWWKGDSSFAMFGILVAWVIGERKFRWPMLACCFAWPLSLIQLIRYGFTWSPVGLLLFGKDLRGINAYEWVDFLMSWSFIGFFLLAGGIAMFGFRFFFHQIRNLMQLDLRRKALPTLAITMAAAGFLQPAMLYGSLTVAFASIVALLFDAVQTM